MKSHSCSHRSYVSYIDKSRVYYAAHGYEHPYRWAHHRDVPFSTLTKPLAKCRIGVVTTADKASRDGPRSTKLFAAPISEAVGFFTETAWDRNATHMDDSETYLPIKCLLKAVRQGQVGSLSPRFYGIPTDYSQRRTTQQDAPQIEAWLREDSVDAVVLVAI